MWPTGNLQIWLYSVPVDMRKSIDGLSIIVAEQLSGNPSGPDVFVFYNRPANQIKLLYWDRNGHCLWYKRLEKGRFSIPKTDEKSYGLTTDIGWAKDRRYKGAPPA